VKLVFADTFYWIALVNPRDSANHQVNELSRSLGSTVILTTDEVLVEFLAFCASDLDLRVQASLVVQDIFSAPNVRVIPQTRSSFLTGFALYTARPDKRYSLTDCISMQAMHRENVSEILTNDRHFQQEGFRAVFRKT
jgi:predicted nucleic acid-binding protein